MNGDYFVALTRRLFFTLDHSYSCRSLSGVTRSLTLFTLDRSPLRQTAFCVAAPCAQRTETADRILCGRTLKQSNLASFFKKVDKCPPTDKPPTGQSPKMRRNDDSSPSTSMWFFMIFIRESLFIFSVGKIAYAFHVCKIFYAYITESLIIVFASERLLYMLFRCIRLFMFFIRGSLP